MTMHLLMILLLPTLAFAQSLSQKKQQFLKDSRLRNNVNVELISGPSTCQQGLLRAEVVDDEVVLRLGADVLVTAIGKDVVNSREGECKFSEKARVANGHIDWSKEQKCKVEMEPRSTLEKESKFKNEIVVRRVTLDATSTGLTYNRTILENGKTVFVEDCELRYR